MHRSGMAKLNRRDARCVKHLDNGRSVMFLSREHELKLVVCGHDPDLALLAPLLFNLLGASLLDFG